jgi:transposase
MPPAAVPVTLTGPERKTLKKRVRGAKTCWRDRLRAQIVLLAARGRSNARIAAGLGIDDGTVRKWRRRFAELGLPGLEDLPRSGRPRLIPEADRAAAVALACQLPAQTGVPLSRWTGPELAAELTAQGLVSAPVSPSSVRRILAENPVKPWRYQSWIFPRDPHFEAKAEVILDLYQGFYQGQPLRDGDHTGRVFASTSKTTGIYPFMTLIGQVMERPEYKNAPRVFVIVDNGSDHRGKAAIGRLRKAHPNAVMIHTPVHASWLNQVEIFFSVIQKKVVSPNDFPSVEKLSETLLAFTGRYNKTAEPFSWKYTAGDLKDLLRRITEHEKQDARHQTGLAEAA